MAVEDQLGVSERRDRHMALFKQLAEHLCSLVGGGRDIMYGQRLEDLEIRRFGQPNCLICRRRRRRGRSGSGSCRHGWGFVSS